MVESKMKKEGREGYGAHGRAGEVVLMILRREDQGIY